MTGLVRKATLLAVCGLLSAGVAVANVPDPANSNCGNNGVAYLGLPACGPTTWPCKAITYVAGNLGGVPDPVSLFCVTVRNFNNVPIQNAVVILDYALCDVQLCFNQLDPDVDVDCLTQTLRKSTDVNGVACFRVMGKTRPPVTCIGPPKDCVRVQAEGQDLCSGDAPTLDIVSSPNPGQDGVNGNDAGEVLKEWLNCGGTNPLHANYDPTNQVINGNDFGQFLKLWLNPAFSKSPANCPGAKDPDVGPKCP